MLQERSNLSDRKIEFLGNTKINNNGRVCKGKHQAAPQAILDARVLYPDCSLSDLNDKIAMPPKLRKVHQPNNRAVMQAYGFDVAMTTETNCVAELMRMRQKLI